jgi:peptide deformylase
MRDASLDWEAHRKHEFCVGLAASQVDDLRRVIILRDNLEDKSDTGFTALINPKIIKTMGEVESTHEGCLSVSDIYVTVPRYNKVKIKAQDENGVEIRITAEGFLARLIQHEIDHTNGVLIIDHVKDDPEAFYKIDDLGEVTKIDYEKEIQGNKNLWD